MNRSPHERGHGGPPEEVDRAKVFISHASEDSPAAVKLAEAILDLGYPVWIDKICIQPGQLWEQATEQAVESSDAVIFMVSRQSVSKTGFVQRELQFAHEQARRRPEGAAYILPLVIDDSSPQPSLGRRHWVFTRDESWFSDIAGALSGVTMELRWRRRELGMSDDDAPDDGAISLTALRVAGQGQRMLTLDYVVDLRGRDWVPVELGAHVLLEDEEELYDVDFDRPVCLRTGVAAYRRRLPYGEELALDGSRLIVGVWWPRIHERCLAYHQWVGQITL